jgi:predicted nucleotidyltransferase
MTLNDVHGTITAMNAPKLIILFGSQARNTAGEQSDTDIAVLAGGPLSLEEKSELGERVAQKLGVSEEKVDVIDLWDAPPLLAHQVGETGKLIEGERFDFNRFRIRAWKQYLDTAKFRRAREQSLKKHVARTYS